jgi:hypothetical protein
MALALRGTHARPRRSGIDLLRAATRVATRRALLVALAVLPFAAGWTARKLVLGIWLVGTWLLATVVLGWRMAGPAARSTNDDESSEGAAPWVGSNA